MKQALTEDFSIAETLKPRVTETLPARYGVVRGTPRPVSPDPMRVALHTIKLAQKLGIRLPLAYLQDALPYSDSHDQLIYDAPLLSMITGLRICFFRGWRQYSSCIKGFNALGLLAEHSMRELDKLTAASAEQVQENKLAFLRSRRTSYPGTPVFNDQDLAAFQDNDFQQIDLFTVAIWKAIASRTIVCSTSSNMGISLHEALRDMQCPRISLRGKTFGILNQDEGRLIIWCPDARADFMNKEKTELLEALTEEHPPLTSLHTYINRKQRDPGALKDVLDLGGYFFPTNPQSLEEMHNLLSISLADVLKERSVAFSALLEDHNVVIALESLGVETLPHGVEVRSGIEGGIYGLMVPYLIMLEETLIRGDVKATSTWNQCSIGAALAAAVFCDHLLRNPDQIPRDTFKQLAKYFPNLFEKVGQGKIGTDFPTSIHGVFDIANLQSLAQLFGIIIEKHLSGRGTAFVGLGSSSYANGNRCYEILRQSSNDKESFLGKSSLHPATHSLNPVAQALVFAEDLHRTMNVPEFDRMSVPAKIELIAKHARKPEEAGAASVAGYLLKRLDRGTLSVTEIVYSLKLAGFRRHSFLAFCGYEEETTNLSRFAQEATEEGEVMGNLAREVLRLLDAPLQEVEAAALENRIVNRINYSWDGLDKDLIESCQPVINLYLTGDNCRQPSKAVIRELLYGAEILRKDRNRALTTDLIAKERLRTFFTINVTKKILGVVEFIVQRVHSWVNYVIKVLVKPTLNFLLIRKLKGSASDGIPGNDKFHPKEEILSCFKKFGQKTFLIESETEREVSYQEFYRLALSAAALLKRNGIGRGDRIFVAMPNSIEFAAVYFGSMFIGAVIVPISLSYGELETKAVISISQAKLLVYSPSVSEFAKRFLALEKIPRCCILTAMEAKANINGGKAAVLEMLAEKAEKSIKPFQNAEGSDLLSILFTSGTTGTPKGVANTIKGSFINAKMFNEHMGSSSASRFLHVWPMTYSSGLLNTLVVPFMAGSSVVLAKPFNASSVLNFWSLAERYAVDTLILSPTMMIALLKLDRSMSGSEFCRKKVKMACSCTAPLPLQVKEDFYNKYQVEVLDSYGLSELLIITAETPRLACRPNSVGRALPGVHLKVVDEEGSDLRPYQEGNILVQTPCIMAGYLNYQNSQPELTLEEDWFRTGDLGYLDSEGNLFISGREKEVIIRGGFNINPRLIEEVLYAHSGIDIVVVVGVPDQFYGEVPAAAVKCKKGYFLAEIEKDLRQLCEEKLNAGSVPAKFVEVNEFPAGAGGKILRKKIGEMLVHG